LREDAERIAGIPWYDREDYPRIVAMMEDAHVLAPVYEQWLAAAENNEREAQRVGVRTLRAIIRPDAFAAWCAERDLPPTSKARMQYVQEFTARAQEG
jgi:hypothetical protein